MCKSRALWTFALLTLAAFSGMPAAWAGPEVGQMAPALTVKTLNGHTFDLRSERGKVVVVNFWATWCPPCREEMPALESFYRKYHAHGVDLIGMSADSPHDRGDVRKVMRAYTYPAAMASDAKDNDFGAPRMLPITYVIDTVGIVRAVLQPGHNPVTAKTLAHIVSQLLPGG